MLRRLGGCGVALALLLPTHATTGSADAAAPTVSAARHAAQPKPLDRTVRLGHRPVRYDGVRPSVRLTFRARKDQLVELADWSAWPENPCVRKTLRDARGRELANWATGYWRLPRTGSYTAVLHRCDDADTRIRVQVRRTVVGDVPVDGPATALGLSPDVTHLVRVRLAAGERLSLRPSRIPRHIVLPSGRLEEDLPYGWLPLDAGYQVAWSAGPGTYYVAARPETTLAVSRARDHAATLDGPAVPLANGGVGAREHVVSFAARAGQWVYPELVDGAGALVTDGRRVATVISPSGARVGSYVKTSCPGKSTSEQCQYLVSGPWRLEEAGTYRMSVRVAGSAPDDTFSLRVRSAALAEPLTLDGPPVTYTSTTPGQWVVGPYTEGLRGGGPMVTAGNASPELTDWRMSLASGFPNQCPPRDTSNGCPDYWHVTLTPDRPRYGAPIDGNAGPSVAVLAVPPGVKGSLEVRLTSQ